MLRAPADPMILGHTANSSEGSADRAAGGAAVPEAPATKPTGKGPKVFKSFDTPQATALIVVAAIAILILLRRGFGSALGD